MSDNAKEPSKWGQAEGIAAKTAIGYGVVTSLYIVFSDKIAAAVSEAPGLLERIQMFKGLSFILITSVLLFLMIRQQTKRLIKVDDEKSAAQKEIIRRLAIAAEWRDDETGEHVLRVSEFAYVIAKNYGLQDSDCERIKVAASMHDVGKIGVSDDVVMFDGIFSLEQRKKMQLHTIIGAQILANGDSDLLQTAHRIALSHHERWDGTGYPYKLKGEEISIEARITAVADVFDALLSSRRYKKPWPWDAAVREIVTNAGTQFDPKVVEAFEVSQPELIKVWNSLKPTAAPEVGKRFHLAV